MSDATPATPPPADDAPAGGTDAPVETTYVPRRTLFTSVNNPFAIGFFLTLGGLVALGLGVAVINLSTVLIYIAFALFAALGLDPIVRFLERRGLGRGWAILIVFAGFAIILVGVVSLVVPTLVRQISQFFSDLPSTINAFQNSDVYAWLQNTFGDQIGNLLSEFETFITNPANIAAIGGGVLQVGATIATTISGLLIVLVLSLYFLASLDTMKVAFTRLSPARYRTKVRSMTDEITDSIGGYLMGMVVLAFFNSLVAFFLHLFLGLPFPALMAVAAFTITLIPLVGPVLYWIFASILALFTSPLTALIFAVAYLIYIQIEAYVLTPRVMSRAIAVPGALVVIGALVGGTLLGLLGALVAIPVTASILLIIKQVVIPRQDAKV